MSARACSFRLGTSTPCRLPWISCLTIPSEAPSLAEPGGWWRLRDLPPNRPPAATPVFIARSLARRRGRLVLIAQWIIAAIVVGFAARELARQWQGVAPALEGLRLDWPRVLASGALVIATYLLLIEAWRATLRVWSESLPFSAAARIWFVSNLGKYVPGKVWQIAAMGALAQKSGVSATAAIGSSLLVN